MLIINTRDGVAATSASSVVAAAADSAVISTASSGNNAAVELWVCPRGCCTFTHSTNDLQVNKYAPKQYIDLIGNEPVNRHVMTWVKQWDYCVFGGSDSGKAKSTTTTRNNVKKMARGGKYHGGEDSYDKYQDALGLARPRHRILLISGRPGLGKTTLASIIARHAGYNVVHINASDERSATSSSRGFMARPPAR